ncbi:hypothetical protein LTR08_003951 [Meristemomyces frigidus]|nr:hypothetical protein LTR08_003951 [Meristemomyces frigidus]
MATALVSLTWALLQERITTTTYLNPLTAQREIFKYPVLLNTLQSALAALLGYLYVLLTRQQKSTHKNASRASTLPIFPSTKILWPLLLVAVTSAVSSPFGYAALAHVDYLTFILAKSCKLVPVMVVGVGVYGKRYPRYKYAVVALVTAGVGVFTVNSGSPNSKSKNPETASSTHGLLLLSTNLLLDGLTNSTQDDIYRRFRPYSGQQMMCALNILSTALTSAYLILEPWIAATAVGRWVGMGGGELRLALGFVARHPGVGWEVLGFAGCGALGQVFIFLTLHQFGSLLLVTVTVTRKMLTMILSVLWFGHRLQGMQWVGVGLVFGGVAVEGELSKREKRGKGKGVEKGKGMEKGKENERKVVEKGRKES